MPKKDIANSQTSKKITSQSLTNSTDSYETYFDPYEAQSGIIHLLSDPIKQLNGYVYTTASGRKLIDALSAASTIPFGNSEQYQEVVRAFTQTCLECPNLTPYFRSKVVTEYRRKLSELMTQIDFELQKDNGLINSEDCQSIPHNLYTVSLGLVGTGSIDAAVKMAKAYNGRKEGRVLSFKNAYHGQSGYAYGATDFGKKRAPSGHKYVPFPTTQTDADKLIKALDFSLQADREEYSAFLIEVIQGDGGINLAPPGFFKQLQETCLEYNVITIADEIQSGFGRTGTFFAFQGENFVPDLVVIGKASSAGVFPISAVIGKAKIVNKLPKPNHVFSFSVHPGGCAAGLKALEVLNDKHISAITGKSVSFLESNVELGNLIQKEITKIKNDPELGHYIKEIRGRGLMLGLEFNKPITAQTVHQYCLEECGVLFGLFGKENHVLRIQPTYIINTEYVKTITEAIKKALQAINSDSVPKEVIEMVKNLAGLGETNWNE